MSVLRRAEAPRAIDQRAHARANVSVSTMLTICCSRVKTMLLSVASDADVGVARAGGLGGVDRGHHEVAD